MEEDNQNINNDINELKEDISDKENEDIEVSINTDDELPEENSLQEDYIEEKPIESKVFDKNSSPDELITVRPVKFQEFDEIKANRSVKKNLDILRDISMHVSVELGRTKSSIKEVMDLEIGSIVELDKIAGEQVEIYVNEKLVAKGEVIVIEDKFGVRVTNTNLTSNRV